MSERQAKISRSVFRFFFHLRHKWWTFFYEWKEMPRGESRKWNLKLHFWFISLASFNLDMGEPFNFKIPSVTLAIAVLTMTFIEQCHNSWWVHLNTVQNTLIDTLSTFFYLLYNGIDSFKEKSFFARTTITKHPVIMDTIQRREENQQWCVMERS